MKAWFECMSRWGRLLNRIGRWREYCASALSITQPWSLIFMSGPDVQHCSSTRQRRLGRERTKWYYSPFGFYNWFISYPIIRIRKSAPPCEAGVLAAPKFKLTKFVRVRNIPGGGHMIIILGASTTSKYYPHMRYKKPSAQGFNKLEE